jgi:hypothetical protein
MNNIYKRDLCAQNMKYSEWGEDLSKHWPDQIMAGSAGPASLQKMISIFTAKIKLYVCSVGLRYRCI